MSDSVQGQERRPARWCCRVVRIPSDKSYRFQECCGSSLAARACAATGLIEIQQSRWLDQVSASGTSVIRYRL